MLKIGDFSRLAHVTVKALHHYDQLGLLRPVWVDRYSGYRYYSLEQLPRLNRILALKDLGFSLDQIRELISAELPAKRLRQMFDQKQQELQQHVVEAQIRLERVAERLQAIEKEGLLAGYEVSLKPLPAQVGAFRRLTLHANDTVERQLSQARGELRERVQQGGLRSLNQWMLLRFESGYTEQRQEVALGLLLAGSPEPIRRSAGFEVRELEATASAASLLHVGGRSRLHEAYAALYAWIETHHYSPSGAARELLLADPGQPNLPAYTELQLPVESILERRKKYLSNPNRKEHEMEPKFVELPAFTVVGMRYYGRNENQEISQMWEVFNQKCCQIQHIHTGSPAYGVCFSVPGAPAGEFEYVASFAVDKVENVPAEMVVREVPAHKYAVFTHVGELDKLGETYRYIYQTWLPQSGYQATGDLDFELYDEDFTGFAPDSRFYIYVALK
ncbi:MAG: GyrI-like domain-containing protein [Anaerolineales bacterium]|jgi:predicted transcriptional regulator YdeE/DNA-binding transcriptional MerR regulator|nr:GyrI-like domain-containing protein [Anaerolineales bacterium]